MIQVFIMGKIGDTKSALAENLPDLIPVQRVPLFQGV
jgi:hypothetical protein